MIRDVYAWEATYEGLSSSLTILAASSELAKSFANTYGEHHKLGEAKIAAQSEPGSVFPYAALENRIGTDSFSSVLDGESVVVELSINHDPTLVVQPVIQVSGQKHFVPLVDIIKRH